MLHNKNEYFPVESLQNIKDIITKTNFNYDHKFFADSNWKIWQFYYELVFKSELLFLTVFFYFLSYLSI